MAAQTLSRRPPRRFWGWGQADAALNGREQANLRFMLNQLGAVQGEAAPPRVEDFALRAPRISPPAALAAMFSSQPLDRLNHSYGKSYADLARMWLRNVPEPPDWVAYPDDEQAIVDLLDWAARHNVAVVPYGGGSSVCGGVEPAVGSSYAGTVSLDMERLSRVLEVDRTSRAARIQAGALGPELEAQLKPHGLTLRHFPQSFEFSTLGGWIATRAGGHYATQHTHIDDFVENTRLVTPAGVMQTRRLPGSGAGPAPDRLVLGSEGTLGVITEAWVRLQDAPRFRASGSVRFGDYVKGVACVRALAQSGLNPANCRLLDPLETVFSGVGDGSHAILVLGFESADHPLQPWMARALELVREHGGDFDAEAVARSMAPEGADVQRMGAQAHRTGAAGAWRDAFLRMPYWRDPAVGLGVIMDTFETRHHLGPLRSLLHRRQGRCLGGHSTRHRQRGAAVLPLHARLPRTARRPTSRWRSMARPTAAWPARWPPGATSRLPPTRL
jgi:alkyldihydroxyacetonephosphate synthase